MGWDVEMGWDGMSPSIPDQQGHPGSAKTLLPAARSSLRDQPGPSSPAPQTRGGGEKRGLHSPLGDT